MVIDSEMHQVLESIVGFVMQSVKYLRGRSDRRYLPPDSLKKETELPVYRRGTYGEIPRNSTYCGIYIGPA
jgi:hypothetical protein